VNGPTKVIIESPYAALFPAEIEKNVAYAKAAVLDCLKRNEAPYASHLFFTQPGLLDDKDKIQRKLGIESGLVWGEAADMNGRLHRPRILGRHARRYHARVAREAPDLLPHDTGVEKLNRVNPFWVVAFFIFLAIFGGLLGKYPRSTSPCVITPGGAVACVGDVLAVRVDNSPARDRLRVVSHQVAEGKQLLTVELVQQ
jgi:hypothetical protein